jgi:hypothetical protein
MEDKLECNYSSLILCRDLEHDEKFTIFTWQPAGKVGTADKGGRD